MKEIRKRNNEKSAITSASSTQKSQQITSIAWPNVSISTSKSCFQLSPAEIHPCMHAWCSAASFQTQVTLVNKIIIVFFNLTCGFCCTSLLKLCYNTHITCTLTQTHTKPVRTPWILSASVNHVQFVLPPGTT